MQDIQTATPGLVLRRDPGTVVLPGDLAATLEPQPQTEKKARGIVRLGTGINQDETDLQVTKAGTFRFDPRRSKLWIDGNQKRYYPGVEDAVIGIVTEKHGEEFRLDLAGTETATLSALAFEGASKRNRPNFNVGALIYCRVIVASRDWEVEVSCVEPGSSKSWVTGETLYGELKKGTSIRVSLAVARCLIRHNNPFLALLGSEVPFESAVGVNGRVWIKAGTVAHTVLVTTAISTIGTMSFPDWKVLVKRLLSRGK